MNNQEYVTAFKNAISIKSRSPDTVENYTSHLRKFLSVSANIRRMTTAQLTAYILKSGGRSMMAQVHTTLNLFYTFVLKQKKVEKWIPYPEKTQFIPKVPTHEQVMKMIETEQYLKHKLIIRMFYATGARLSELCNLKWIDIKRENGVNPLSIHVTGKGKKDRLIPVSKETMDLLLDFWKKTKHIKTNYVFGDVKPYAVRSAQKVIKQAGNAVGIKVTPHKLRHAFAMNHRKAGIDLGRLQELMGHASLDTTRVYAGVDNLTVKPLL